MKQRLLTSEELAQFNDHGFVVAEDVISHTILDDVITDLDKEIDNRAGKLFNRGLLSSTYDGEGFETRLAKISAETDQLALSIWNHVLHGPGIFRLLTCKSLVDVAEQLVGPEIIASSVYRLRPKIPNYGYGAVPWHQDSAYFEPFCDNHLVLTFWVPLVDATLENGCLWVIPDSHRSEVVGHKASESGRYLEIEQSEFPRTGKRIACPVKKGGMLIMTNRTAHASFLNKTDGVRWSMDLRYQSAELPTNADITRLSGDMVESAENGVPAACYPPEADFLVRSEKRPDEVISTPEQFAMLRENHKPLPVTNRFNVTWKEPQILDL